MVITSIGNVDIYQAQLDEFTNNVKRFYNIGKRSFLTNNTDTPGDDETFYMHTLRFYMPRLSIKTLKEHKMGMLR